MILWPKPLYLLGCSGVIKPIKTSTSALPTDTHALQQMVLQMQAELSDNHKKLSAQDSVIDNLRHQLAVLKRARFGRSSEQVEHNIHQLELQLEELEIAQAQTTPSSSAASTAKKTPRRRITLPEHLAREEYRLDTHECCPDCQGALCHIGDDVSEILDVVPASYRVIKTVRPKYSCKACDSVVQASAPQRVINKGLPSAALLTQVMVDKYMDHQPLYRQAQQMAREEIDVERSTLADWVGQVDPAC